MVKQSEKQHRDEVARLGHAKYAKRIRPKLVRERRGRIVAMDVDSGEYEVGDEVIETSERLLARKPRARIWLVRIGYRTFHRFGAWGNGNAAA